MILGFLLERLPWMVVLWLSLTVHEWAHARTAFALGDNTASAQGRMTLDPLAHIDPVGTFLLPLAGIPFGWALPVPVDPARFTRRIPMTLGMLLCAAAGPLSNVILAVLGLVAVGIGAAVLPYGLQDLVLPWLGVLVNLNVALAIFNLMPVPPLDGSRVVNHFLPRSLRGMWESLETAGRFLPFAVLMLLAALGIDPISPAFRWTDWVVGRIVGAVS
jgi:Zn-dependent protease